MLFTAAFPIEATPDRKMMTKYPGDSVVASAARPGARCAASTYLQSLAASLSVPVLVVPGTNETLNRSPVGHPLGSSSGSPVMRPALAAVFWLFLVVTAYQMRKLTGPHRSQATLVYMSGPLLEIYAGESRKPGL